MENIAPEVKRYEPEDVEYAPCHEKSVATGGRNDLYKPMKRLLRHVETIYTTRWNDWYGAMERLVRNAGNVAEDDIQEQWRVYDKGEKRETIW